ncbi:MAG TPA: hypothetical protein VJY64_00215 [Candidatus Onthovivens sp.]|nr:hypothetical protein [Candidatus Onthovivens sp.]
MNFDRKNAIKNAMVDSIIDIDKLIECGDYETIKDGLTNYPLTVDEYVEKIFNEGKKRTVFQYMIDNNYIDTARWFVNSKGEETFQSVFETEFDNKIRDGVALINDKYFYPGNDRYLYGYSDQKVTHEEVAEKILKELALKLDKQTLTAGLTKEYFDKLFEQGEYELLVIKLCVRLEAILKCDFHYEGTFEEMLSKYSTEYGFNVIDDGWGYTNNEETYLNELFHKLRKYRNDIVHAEKNQESLSEEQLKNAIECVCKLG